MELVGEVRFCALRAQGPRSQGTDPGGDWKTDSSRQGLLLTPGRAASQENHSQERNAGKIRLGRGGAVAQTDHGSEVEDATFWQF